MQLQPRFFMEYCIASDERFNSPLVYTLVTNYLPKAKEKLCVFEFYVYSTDNFSLIYSLSFQSYDNKII